ncbi:MAG: SPASM domain-containing protein [Candidatus Woesearchaeota archaeon]
MAKTHNNIVDLKQSTSVISDNINLEEIDVDKLEKQIHKIENLNSLTSIKSIKLRPDLRDESGIERYFDYKGKKITNSSKCFFPYNQLSIKTNGDVLVHSRCLNYFLGNIYQDNIEDVFYGENATIFRNKLKKFNYCFPACTRCCGIMGEWKTLV